MERLINKLIFRYSSELHSLNQKLDLLLFSNSNQSELFDEIYSSLVRDKQEVLMKIEELSTMRKYLEEGNSVEIETIINYI